MNDKIPIELRNSVNTMLNLECWYVNAGKGVGSSFSISLGNKVPRKVQLKNAYQTEEYQKYEGEVNLLIWCSWRLETRENSILSSDDDDRKIEKTLKVLLGRKIIEIEIIPPVWDLRIEFSGGYRLKIFCDHLSGNPSFDDNWDLKIRDKILFAGPGIKWGFESDENI